jgi:hypothetical protein
MPLLAPANPNILFSKAHLTVIMHLFCGRRHNIKVVIWLGKCFWGNNRLFFDPSAVAVILVSLMQQARDKSNNLLIGSSRYWETFL